MKLKLGITLLLVTLLTGCASYTKTILEPWVGATESELIRTWGYPQIANDIVRVDGEKKVYSYRRLYGGGTICVVSFVLESNRVTGFNFTGAECPRKKRSSVSAPVEQPSNPR